MGSRVPSLRPWRIGTGPPARWRSGVPARRGSVRMGRGRGRAGTPDVRGWTGRSEDLRSETGRLGPDPGNCPWLEAPALCIVKNSHRSRVRRWIGRDAPRTDWDPAQREAKPIPGIADPGPWRARGSIEPAPGPRPGRPLQRDGRPPPQPGGAAGWEGPHRDGSGPPVIRGRSRGRNSYARSEHLIQQRYGRSGLW